MGLIEGASTTHNLERYGYLPNGFGTVPRVSILGFTVSRLSPKNKLKIVDILQIQTVALHSSLRYSALRLEGRKAMVRR